MRPYCFRASSCRALPTSPWVRKHVHRITTALLAIAVSFETVVVILYWVLLYRGVPVDETAALYFGRNCLIHGIVMIPPWVEVLAGSHRLHNQLSLPLLAATISYLIVNVSWTRAVRPVYAILTWQYGSDAIIVIGTMIAVQGFFFLAAALSWEAERWARGRWARCAATEPPPAPARVPLAISARAVATAAPWAGADREAAGGAEGRVHEATPKENAALADPLCERAPFDDAGSMPGVCACCGCGGGCGGCGAEPGSDAPAQVV